MVDHVNHSLKSYTEGPSFKVLRRVICVYLNDATTFAGVRGRWVIPLNSFIGIFNIPSFLYSDGAVLLLSFLSNSFHHHG